MTRAKRSSFVHCRKAVQEEADVDMLSMKGKMSRCFSTVSSSVWILGVATGIKHFYRKDVAYGQYHIFNGTVELLLHAAV